MMTLRSLRRLGLAHGLVWAVSAFGCQQSAESAPAAGAPSASGEPATSGEPMARVAEQPSPETSASASPDGETTDAVPKANTEGCKEGMIRVEGEYCPALMQDCLKHHPEFENDPTVSERCLEFLKPSRCVSKKRETLSFCMDRYEYPNKVGELPRLLTDWYQAKARCEEQGKRLCTEDEYNFACEGPDMLPYVYGYVRDDTKCNIDKPYHQPDHSKRMLHYDECLKDDRCKKELARMDQRHRIGSTHTCVSWAGIIDLNGNVNEWVNLPGEKRPNRSGLKGGWWGPVRGRCRPTVTFHKENDYGYEVGFRCCADPK